MDISRWTDSLPGFCEDKTMNSRTFLVIGAAAVLLLTGVFVMGIFTGIFTGTAVHGPVPLEGVEVRSYQSEDLSSINDFHENSIRGPQYINVSDYRLTVTGLTKKTRVYSYDEVLSGFTHYSKVTTLHCVEGWDVTLLFEGVRVRDVIADAGVDPRANTVIFTAHDGYTTSFPLNYFTNHDILMAYKMNNVTLPAERGYPFELVAEDKWGYKWIKWIEKIELTDDPTYRGYWEERGYSNTGDLNVSFSRE
jgi:DMSO/TMAO reductase YedYZ molybdopterin-dependent catalytic subunit